MEKKELIEKNIRLVKYIASKKMGRNLDFYDLVQEGCIELIKSIEKYDETRKCKLSTFMFPRINKAMNVAIYNQSRTIRLPINVQERIAKALNTENELAIKLNRQPKIEEIAVAMKKIEKKVNDLFRYRRENSVLSFDSYISDGDISLKRFDHLISEYLTEFEILDGDLCLEMFIPSKDASPEEIVIDKLEKENETLKINQLFILSNLTERETEFLKLRYGFYGKTKTLNEVGKIYGISKQAVSQTELAALKKIRESEYIKLYYRQNNNLKNNDETVHESNQTKLKINIKKISTFKKYKLKRPNKAFYEYFAKYTRDEVNNVLINLNEEESYLILCLYGGNLENKINDYFINSEQEKIFHNYLIPKIQKQLTLNKKC